MFIALDCNHTPSKNLLDDYYSEVHRCIMTQIATFIIFLRKFSGYLQKKIQQYYECDIFITHSVAKFSSS